MFLFAGIIIRIHYDALHARLQTGFKEWLQTVEIFTNFPHSWSGIANQKPEEPVEYSLPSYYDDERKRIK